MVGYTPREAKRLKDQLDLDMAKIEDAARAMRDRVPDLSLGVEGGLEELRMSQRQAIEALDRRTVRATDG